MKPCSKIRSDKSTCAKIFLEPTLTNAGTILEWMHHHAIDHLPFWHSRRSGIHKHPPEVFLKMLFHRKTYVLESLIYKAARLQDCLKKTLTQVFFCEIWEILKNTYLEEHLNDCFCVLITSLYIDFYNHLQFHFFFNTQLKQ